MKALTEKQQEAFLNLACALSPENLCCDGELSRAETNRRYRALMVKWHALEKGVGRKVSEDEVWDTEIKSYTAGRK